MTATSLVKAAAMPQAMAASLMDQNGVCKRQGPPSQAGVVRSCLLTLVKQSVIEPTGATGFRLVCCCCEVGDAKGCPHTGGA